MLAEKYNEYWPEREPEDATIWRPISSHPDLEEAEKRLRLILGIADLLRRRRQGGEQAAAPAQAALGNAADRRGVTTGQKCGNRRGEDGKR